MTGVKRKTLLVVAVNVALCALLVEGFAAVALRSLHGQWTSSSGYVAAVSGRTEDPGDGAAEPGTGEQEGAAAKLHAPRWMLQPYFGFARNPEAQTHRLAGARVTVPVNDHGLFGPSPLGGQSDGTFHVALAGGSVALELYLYSRQALADDAPRVWDDCPGNVSFEWEGGDEAHARVLGIADHSPNVAHAHLDDFSSQHPAGANFLLADGSVRLINETIEINVYKALATRQGGEVAQLD